MDRFHRLARSMLRTEIPFAFIEKALQPAIPLIKIKL